MSDLNQKLAQALRGLTEGGAPVRDGISKLFRGDVSPLRGAYGEVKQLFDPEYMKGVKQMGKDEAFSMALDANPVMAGMVKNAFGRFPENIKDVESLTSKLTKHLNKNNIPFAFEDAGYAGNSKYFTIGKNLEKFNAENKNFQDAFIHSNSSATLPSRAQPDDYGLFQVRIADHPNKYQTDLSIHPFEDGAYRRNGSYEESLNEIDKFVKEGGVKKTVEQKTIPKIDNRQTLASIWVQEQKRNRPAGMSNKEWEKLGITANDWDGWK